MSIHLNREITLALRRSEFTRNVFPLLNAQRNLENSNADNIHQMFF
jgi:hypothetical protein